MDGFTAPSNNQLIPGRTRYKAGTNVDLHFRELASEKAGCPIILLHGLYGSAANLQTIGKALTDRFRVILPDLRNHGRSAHDDDVSYPSMADDVLSLMDKLGCEQVDLLGHSMGGKVAMWLSLNHPERVNHLIVADIAPVTYPNRFSVINKAMQGLELHKITGRQDADEKLSELLSNASLRSYLLQNLVLNEDQWQWRINLSALVKGMRVIKEFPATSAEFAKPALFMRGELSSYINAENEADLLNYFPLAEIVTVPGAGHWLYAEQPEQFIAAVKQFLPLK